MRQSKETTEEICLICGRDLTGTKKVSKHHLIPKSRGGRNTPTILIHNICHQKIHSVFTEKQLRDDYHTIEKLIAHEDMAKFIKWVGKKHVDFYNRNRGMKSKW